MGKGKGMGKGSGKGKGKGKGKGDGRGPRPSDADPSAPTTERTESNPLPDAKRRKVLRERPQLDEKDVGIQCRLFPEMPRFSGSIKTRISDFLVNEIGLDGQVARVTERTVPEHLRKANFRKVEAPEAEGSPEQGMAKLSEILTPEEFEAFQTFQTAAAAYEALPPWERKRLVAPDGVTFSKARDKAERTAIHLALKTNFPTLVADTVAMLDASGQTNQRVRVRCPGGPGPVDRRYESKWPERLPEYLHFSLLKYNVDSGAALSALATRLATTPKAFNVAGTKDKRGVTCQRVSLRKVFAENVATLTLPHGFRVGNFEYRPTRLNLGDLKGNLFTVVLRGVSSPDAYVDRVLQAVRDHGFLNYFGMQRFGTTSIPTHKVGIAIVKKDYRGAVDLIMASGLEINDAEFREAHDTYHSAKLAYQQGDKKTAMAGMSKALSLTPRWMKVERALLSRLADPNDALNYGQALGRIPRHLRMMYLHALQSFVWNTMVSRRMELYGRAAVAGDLILADGADLDGVADPPEDVEGDVDGDDDTPAAAEDVGKERGGSLPAVKVLTAEEAAAHTLADVVMPLPGGGEVQYPEHACDREAYKSFLQAVGAEGLLDASRCLNVGSAVHGGYRRVVHRPGDFSWEIRTYLSPEETVVENDWDAVPVGPVAVAAPAPVDSPPDSDPMPCDSTEPPSPAPEPPRKAVVLRFSLPSSTYATMLVREFCEEPTAPSVPVPDPPSVPDAPTVDETPAVGDPIAAMLEDATDLQTLWQHIYRQRRKLWKL
jgi:tRNA pseudouridine13 synthase